MAQLGEELYDIKPARGEDVAADSGDEDGDIEASIKKELDGFSKPSDEEAAAVAKKAPFSIITVQTECVFFVKTKAPVEPIEFCRRACEQAKACTNLLERKTKYINRLTPVTIMDKASDNGVERAIRHALAPCFDLKKLDTETQVEQEATAGDTASEAAREVKPACSVSPALCGDATLCWLCSYLPSVRDSAIYSIQQRSRANEPYQSNRRLDRPSTQGQPQQA